MEYRKMTEEEVRKRFRLGYLSYKEGWENPGNSDRVQAFGWRFAQQEELNYKCALEQCLEVYCELGREGLITP